MAVKRNWLQCVFSSCTTFEGSPVIKRLTAAELHLKYCLTSRFIAEDKEER